MIKSYFLVAIRNLLKNKLFSFINIFGLSVGIAAALLIINFLRFERSYDQFYSNNELIFRVPMEITEKGGERQTFAFTYPAVAGALKNDFPEIDEAIRFKKVSGLVIVDEKIIADLRAFWVDEQVFNVFSLSFLYGDSRALSELNNAVITQSMALKLFGEVDVRGKTFSFFNNQVFKVGAVINDVPEVSHIKFDFLLPYQKYIELIKKVGGDADNSWNWSDFYTYILLKPGVQIQSLKDRLSAFVQRYKGQDMKANSYEVSFQFQPLNEIHTKSHYDYELEGNGNFTYLDYVAIAALFILLMAWLNFINLSTSRSLERSKEVGIRKTVGAHRVELINQFLFDALIVNGLAIIAGTIIFLLVNPYLAQLTGKPLFVPLLTDYSWWGFILAFLLAGSLLSGFYPAFVLSSFKPSQALKGKSIAGNQDNKAFLRKTLVVAQVSLAVILISGTLSLVRQLQFMRNQDLGVNIRQTLVLRDRVNRDSTSVPVIASFMNEIKRNPSILSVTASTDVPGKEIGGSSVFHRSESGSPKRCRNFEIDNNFFNDYQLELLAGHGFSQTKGQEKSVVLNETAMKVLGFENAEGTIDAEITDGEETYKVIGVVKDYHQKSLHYDFTPTIFFFQEYDWDYYSLKVDGNDMTSVVADAEKTWKQFFPESPFDYFFLDEYYDAQYKSERTFSVLLGSFTIIGIVVASLGLLGLSLFTVAKRTKEIGVRKVLGASVIQIVSMVTKEYLLLVTIAFGVAIPVSYLMVNQWMQGYTFRMPLNIWFALNPLLLILIITLLSVGLQSIRAASTNPINSLRNE